MLDATRGFKLEATAGFLLDATLGLRLLATCGLSELATNGLTDDAIAGFLLAGILMIDLLISKARFSPNSHGSTEGSSYVIKAAQADGTTTAPLRVQ